MLPSHPLLQQRCGMKNFPSQRMPCIPINKVGTLWEASQDVGMAFYKTKSLHVKVGFYLYLQFYIY